MPRTLVPYALIAVAGCSAPASPTRTPSATPCLRDRGCPPPAPLQACPAGLDARLVATVIGDRTLIGQPVVVRGPLVRGNANCTEIGCVGSRCCNRCGASLQLGVATPGADIAAARATTLQLLGRPGCSGDESQLCCRVAVDGQDAIARGTLRVMEQIWALEPFELCAPSTVSD